MTNIPAQQFMASAEHSAAARDSAARAECYHFANRTWLERLLCSSSRPSVRRIGVFSLVPFVVCGIHSVLADCLSVYLNNPAIYYGTFGIFLTALTVVYASHSQHRIHDVFLSSFDLTGDDKRLITRDTLERYSSTTGQLLTSVAFFLACFLVAALGYWHTTVEPYLSRFGFMRSFQLRDFDLAGWYELGLRNNAMLWTSLYALFVCLLLGTSYKLMLDMPVALLNSTKYPVRLLPRLIKQKFGPLASFYSSVSVLWCIGVTLLAILIRGTDNWLLRGGVGSLAIIGLVNFIIPQIIYIHTVERAEAFWLNRVSRELAALDNRSADLAAQGNSIDSPILHIDGYYLSYERFVYPIHETYYVAIAQIASILSFRSLF